jgi:hypothetical protein
MTALSAPKVVTDIRERAAELPRHPKVVTDISHARAKELPRNKKLPPH